MGRNEPCPCGSGRKYKKCCIGNHGPQRALLNVDECLRAAAEHVQAGRLLDADQVLEQILIFRPDNPDALHLSGHVADRLGRPGALPRINRAISSSPLNPAYHNTLGIALGQSSRAEEAIASFREALALKPLYPHAMRNLALQLTSVGAFDEADDYYRQLLTITPNSVDLYVNLAQLRQLQGRIDEASQQYEQALSIESGHAGAHGGRIINALYQASNTYGDLLRIAKLFGEPHEQALAAHRYSHTNILDPDKRLKIGYVSADFRRHSVAYFIEPILACHNKCEFEVYAYSTGSTRDDFTKRFEKLVNHWIAVGAMNDAALAERIRADGIDILVDLSGHSAGNRLLVFARKPAPVQISWIGFLATTGLKSMDYRITDFLADPLGCEDALYTEKLIRLPRTCLCYRPPAAAPPVAPPPAGLNGYVTFGSFNSPSKYDPTVIKLWAEILTAVPNSRLQLKGRGLGQGQLRSMMLQRFTDEGVDANRLVLQSQESDEALHLSRYNEIDIGLDPFPYNGITTTCEALWMGVPVIALRGDRHSSRMGASLVLNVGLPECVTESTDEYRTVAIVLANDLPHLAELRSGMRARMRKSALMDEVGVTREVEAAFREVWWVGCQN